MRKFNLHIIIGLVLFNISCSHKKVRYNSVIYESRGPRLIQNEKYPLSYEEIKRKDKLMNDDLMKTIFSIRSDMKCNSTFIFYTVDKLTSFKLSLYKMSSDEFQLPSTFYNYMPSFSNNDSLKINWYTVYGGELLPDFYARYIKKKKITSDVIFKSDKEFKIYSTFFPQNFYFPKDFINSGFYLQYQTFADNHSNRLNRSYNETLERFGDTKKYLIITLPKYVNFRQQPDEIYLKDSIYIDNKKFEEAHGILNTSILMLHPGIESYLIDIFKLWELYLIKIKFQELGFKNKLVSIKLPRNLVNPLIVKNGFVSDTLSLNNRELYEYNTLKSIRSYLLNDFNNGGALYKSYFEVLLWYMYRVNEFNENKTEPKNASFTFTSRNPDYPGNYEVFFNIYAPYEFKVKKK